uniref:Uncharacterized protein n=1 Tax=Cyclophora tenuis TaxID=216820 RepID=A0A7S1DE12_CYCTE|mmetsp:Transcript_8843/g.14874  ORF Transcript_8843/g.14874 Transcript_8843/m.14874 type:complete len:105 (+) Transcript_8843:136-450(+)
MTVFTLLKRNELHRAYEVISKMISPPGGSALQYATAKSTGKDTWFRGDMVVNPDVGLSFHIVRCRQTGAAQCISVTLVSTAALAKGAQRIPLISSSSTTSRTNV